PSTTFPLDLVACAFLLLLPTLSIPPFPFNLPATTYRYTLSLHDALPIFAADTFEIKLFELRPLGRDHEGVAAVGDCVHVVHVGQDRKSTRLNSSHRTSSYAVFCLKKKRTSG